MRVICKTCTETFANNADSDQTPCSSAASDQVCTVCLNYRKLNEHLSLLRDYFPRLHSETIDPPVLSVP